MTVATIRARVRYWQDRAKSLSKTYFPTGGMETRTSRSLFLFNTLMAVQLIVNDRAFGPLRSLTIDPFWLYVYVVGFLLTGVLHLLSSMHWSALSLDQTLTLRRSAYTASIIVTLGWILLYVLSGVQLGGLFGALYPWFLILYFKLTAFQSSMPESESRSKAKLRKEIRRVRS
jgi:hypothetical protein